jgi:hypothetical protein
MPLSRPSATVILLGIGLAVAAPAAVPALTAVGRPIAKGAIRSFLAISDYVQEFFSEVGERWSDLLAEVESENGARPITSPGVEAGKRPRSVQA